MVRVTSTILLLASALVNHVHARVVTLGAVHFAIPIRDPQRIANMTQTGCEVTSAKPNVADCADVVNFIGYWGTAYLVPGGPCWEIGNGTCGARICNVNQGGSGSVNLTFEQAAVHEGVFQQCVLKDH